MAVGSSAVVSDGSVTRFPEWEFLNTPELRASSLQELASHLFQIRHNVEWAVIEPVCKEFGITVDPSADTSGPIFGRIKSMDKKDCRAFYTKIKELDDTGYPVLRPGPEQAATAGTLPKPVPPVDLKR